MSPKTKQGVNKKPASSTHVIKKPASRSGPSGKSGWASWRKTTMNTAINAAASRALHEAAQRLLSTAAVLDQPPEQVHEERQQHEHDASQHHAQPQDEQQPQQQHVDQHCIRPQHEPRDNIPPLATTRLATLRAAACKSIPASWSQSN